MARRLGVTVDAGHVAACVGTKELVAGVPQWLRLRRPDLDTVLYPAISYPTYAMGATLAGCRAVPYVDLDDIDPDRRGPGALPLGERAGQPDRRARRPRAAAAAWGRAHGVPVLSDECYVEFTWDGPRSTILEHGVDGVLAVHSLSKRSNLAGRAGGLLRRRSGLSSATSPRCASTPASWCPVRSRRPRWRPGPTTPTSSCNAPATRTGWR